MMAVSVLSAPRTTAAASPSWPTSRNIRYDSEPETLRPARPRTLTPCDRYYADVGETPLLDEEEEKELARRVAEGDADARNRMVTANLRLVIRIARTYCGRGLDLQDLIEDGNLGLISAVERFDPKQKVRFSTYAAYWIRQAIQRGIQNATRPIRFPAHVCTLLSKWRRASNEIRDEIGRPPTVEEVAKRLGLSARKRRAVEKALWTWNCTFPAETHTPRTPVELAADTRPSSPSTANAERAATREWTRELLDQLEEREATVLRLRFGLDDGQPLTLEEVGQRLELTRERIRQIERKALAKLRELAAA